MVERTVVEATKGETVMNRRFTLRVGVGDDMGRVQEFLVAEATKRALALIGLEDPLAEGPLMEPDAHEGSDVGPPRRRGVVTKYVPALPFNWEGLLVVDRDRHGEVLRIIAHHKDRPCRNVLGRRNPVEVDERRPLYHRGSQPHIVWMLRIGPPISISEEVVGPEGVVVGTAWGSGDGERHFLQDPGLEDSLGADKRDPVPLELKALSQECAGQYVGAQPGDLIGQPAESGSSDLCVVGQIHSRPVRDQGLRFALRRKTIMDSHAQPYSSLWIRAPWPKRGLRGWNSLEPFLSSRPGAFPVPLIDTGAALFAGTSREFAEWAPASRLTAYLTAAFRSRWGNVSESEIRAWKNSLTALAAVVDQAGLPEAGAGVELKLPHSSRRIDAFFAGHSVTGHPTAMLVELKQWESAGPSQFPDNVVIGGAEHVHPSVQVADYADYLRGSHSAFTEEGLGLIACAYLHNMSSTAAPALRGLAYEAATAQAAFYVHGEEPALAEAMRQCVGNGDGMALLPKIVRGRYSPSPALLDGIARALQASPVWILLDEQRLAFNIVRGLATKAANTGQKSILIVTGGPGTGKSVIAAHLLVKLAQSHGYRVAHATGSKAFTTNLRAIGPRGANAVFRYFNNFRERETKENDLDVLICDEAHRIRESSNDRRTPKAKRSQIAQVDELIRAARVAVFLLDERQNVRPGETGTVSSIREAADRLEVPHRTVALDTQFRCNGCGEYIRWVNALMSDEPIPAGAWLPAGDYDLRVFDSPDEMERSLHDELRQGYTGRLVAGFCWPWSDPKPDGSLELDVVINNWHRPWNEKSREQRKKPGAAPPPNRHPYFLWATQPERVREVGCIYSAQGFEFDYCAVIIGNDLVCREGHGWIASRDASRDKSVARPKMPEPALRSLLQQTYRVLLTRGMRGTFIYSTDFETREMLKGLVGRLH